MSDRILTIPLHNLVMIKTISPQKKHFSLKLEELKPYLENYRLSPKEKEKIIDNEYALGRVGKDEIC